MKKFLTNKEILIKNKNINANDNINYFNKKMSFAQEKGFKTLVIWEDEVFDSSINKAINFIKNNIKHVR